MYNGVLMKRVSEILEEVSKEKSINKKVELLQAEASNEALRAVLQATFDERIVFELPEGAPPYNEPNDMIDNKAGLYREYRKFYIFTKNRRSAEIRMDKREYAFIQMLESVHPEDAKLLLAMKDKKMPYKTVTKNLVLKAYGEDFVK